jgi:hypothetical protein
VSANERVKRPPLSRAKPVRSWSTLLGASESTARPSTDPGDFISRSVELGYQVVDDYIRQGRKVAERLGERSLGPAALTPNVQELGTLMMQYASDFMGVWMQFMEIAMRGSAPPPAASAQPAAPQAEGGGDREAARDGASSDVRGPEGTRVRIEVASLWPTEVWLDLRPEAARASVVAHALRAADPDVPRLDDVSFTNGSDDPPLFRVRIPPSQPPGVYNGLLVDQRTSRPVGTVSVRVWRT